MKLATVHIEQSMDLFSKKRGDRLGKTDQHGKKFEQLLSRIQNIETSSSSVKLQSVSAPDTDFGYINEKRCLNDPKQCSQLKNLEIHGLKLV